MRARARSLTRRGRGQGSDRTANDLAHAPVIVVDASAASDRTRRFARRAVLDRLGAGGLASRARPRGSFARRKHVSRRARLDLGDDRSADRCVATAGLVLAAATGLDVVLAAGAGVTRLVRLAVARRRPRRTDALDAPVKAFVGLRDQLIRRTADAPRRGRRCRWTAVYRSCASTS